MFNNYPTFWVGDFNYVGDPYRDVSGRKLGRKYTGVRALKRLVRNFKLRDAWMNTHGDEFIATWQRGSNISQPRPVILSRGAGCSRDQLRSFEVSA